MKKVVVLGAGGFIGYHLVKFLKKKGYWVRGVDIKKPEFSKSAADEFKVLDLRKRANCLKAIEGVEEVYQLAAQMGGMGYISKEHLAAFHDSNLINTYVAEASTLPGVKRVFFSSSACVYPTFYQNTLKKNLMTEEDAVPAIPNEAYGWEKLMAELRYLAYEKEGYYKTRIARFENCYGPEGTYRGGREKAPAALCRKVAEAGVVGNKDVQIYHPDSVKVWGDGKQMRSFMYIDDCVEGIYKIMRSRYSFPINLGSDEVVSINSLAKRIIKISGKKLKIKNVKGPQGVRSRYISHKKAEKLLGWRTKVSLNDGLEKTYKWIDSQVHKT